MWLVVQQYCCRLVPLLSLLLVLQRLRVTTAFVVVPSITTTTTSLSSSSSLSFQATSVTRTSVDRRKYTMSALNTHDHELQQQQEQQEQQQDQDDDRKKEEELQLFDSLHFRLAQPDDIPECFAIESASYPSDEMATLQALTYRQAHATEYFLLVELPFSVKDQEQQQQQQQQQQEENNDSNNIMKRKLIGFCCATRCAEFTEESMSTQHDPTGPLLAIHSVVIQEQYRRRGIASRLLQTYLQHVQHLNIQFAVPNNDMVATNSTTTMELLLQKNDSNNNSNDKKSTSIASTIPTIPAMMESIVLLSKSHLLGFYVNCGFSVVRPSPIVHGKELWYDLERKLIQTLPNGGDDGDGGGGPGDGAAESWFIKTEQFKKSFPQVQPHLKAHSLWVQQLRATGNIGITSGYRVDAQGKPGGGGFMILTAKSYQEAMEIVLQDPLIVNDCVTWELNGWIGQVGSIQLR